ncbi:MULTISPECIES: DUF4382 domain-containing protein [unclassified Coleofasciculus]|uniref:DUF4382 domain-containing protein n=1 Tax=unclassified Coleofasciculus TaxID=2692782 RepID=UPI00187F7B06|nr:MULTISPECIES: DUF4382 domain-containing protein [unclassified Coleofasciculus]MBE9128912.1 DUF4382 domain-containing protein [Coleofasciculus sp. LEGE 07081]MBE9151650.1 DUF4382 domain-containing protein [Coleofasciculus sp. LEGE 07092]
MRKPLLILASLTFLAPGILLGCSENGVQTETQAGAPAAQETQTQAQGGEGTLQLVANGEDFVRQGFVTKDGWQIDFEHVYVTLDDVTAYQTDPPFDPDKSGELKATEKLTLLDEPKTVDLAAGDGDAAPITVTSQPAPMGTYNALSWNLVEANQGSVEGSTILLEGTAEKEGRIINFTISFDKPLEYTCGQYVGEERKGILKNTDQTEIETTFHFDHIFGDANAPEDDALNQDAIGFEPFAALAQEGTLKADRAMLKQELPSEDYQKLEEAIAGLGHVGEGHCRIEGATAQGSEPPSPE